MEIISLEQEVRAPERAAPVIRLPGKSEFLVEDDIPPLVKPGIYDLVLDSYETRIYYGGKAPRLVMWFRIVDMAETVLPRYYTVKRTIGRPQKGGRFVASKKGDFLSDYLRLFSHNVTRLDRLPMTKFDNVVIRGRVVTVEKDSKQNGKHRLVQYSKVGQLLKVVK